MLARDGPLVSGDQLIGEVIQVVADATYDPPNQL